MIRLRMTIPILLLLLAALGAFGQPGDYPHPELKWYSIETDHFYAYYHEGAERTAKTCLKIAEEVYDPITSLYGYEPDGKIRFLIKDTDDYSNGGAYYYDNKILIWASALDWDLRGEHNWLRNVVTHEFTHMIQLGASRKTSRQVPGLYLQWMNYEEERRPDVLYGFPNVLVSYPIAMTVMPHWFAEGTAQCQAPGFGYDSWDSHRDMILRTRVLTGTLLTLDEIGHFGRNSIGNESTYNLGFSLVGYIRNNYGDQSLQEISAGMKKFSNYSFDRAVRNSIGIGEQELYSAWKDSLENFYRVSTETIKQNIAEGEKHYDKEAYGSFYPSFISGDEVIYLSNKGQDYMSRTSLYKRNLSSGEINLVKKNVRSRPYVSDDGKWVVYAAKRKPVKRSMLDDLYIYNLTSEEEHRLTKGARATSPALSHDNSRIAFVVNGGGTRNLAIAEMPDITVKKNDLIESWTMLTNYKDGEQVHNPVFHPDGKHIAFEYSFQGSKDIYLINIEDGSIEPVLSSVVDERNPAFTPDGENMLYSSDRTGIFNIYTRNLETGAEELLTNVLGGAFMGRLSDTGKMVYSGYADNGFHIFEIDDPAELEEENSVYLRDYPAMVPQPEYNDRELPGYTSGKYQPVFGKLFFLPRLALDLESFKPGIYVYSTDFMEWFSIFGGFSFNGLTEDPKFFQGVARLNPKYIGDYDLFGMIEYNNIIPTFFVEGYNIMRKSHQEFDDNQKIIGEVVAPGGELVPIFDKYAIEYRFSLGEVDAGFRYKLGASNSLELRGIASRYSAKLRFDDGFDFSYSYFKGKSVALRWEGDYRPPMIEMDINPSQGRHFITEFARENNAFIDSFKVDAGLLKEVYSPYNYNRFSIQWEEYKKSPLGDHHSFTVRLNAAGIDRDNVDDFFFLYAGGLPGLKGYSYYSVGGPKKLVSSFTYRFPLFRNINRRYLHTYIHSVYMGLFFDYGNAWAGDLDFGDFKKDAGISLRTQLSSFYSFPTAVSFEAAYGLDEFTVIEPDFERVYGKEWRYYLTILFNFNLMLGNDSFNRRM